MPHYEYKTVPAPRKGEKAKGVKGADGRLAQAMQSLLNTYGAQGWEYQRAETLPVQERSGLTSKSVSYQSVLIFRRELNTADQVSAQPTPAVVAPIAPAQTDVEESDFEATEEHSAADALPSDGFEGVEKSMTDDFLETLAQDAEDHESDAPQTPSLRATRD